MWNVPYTWGTSLHTWSSAVLLGKVVEYLEGEASLEEVGHQRWDLRLYCPAPFPVHLLFYVCKCNVTSKPCPFHLPMPTLHFSIMMGSITQELWAELNLSPSSYFSRGTLKQQRSDENGKQETKRATPCWKPWWLDGNRQVFQVTFPKADFHLCSQYLYGPTQVGKSLWISISSFLMF